ncbi:MAG TPA: extracellular solute-binding protein [Dehalococcoidia bacterium]|nr:extracellular solute-binding protein [Dehalococcoidia bacterium]HLB29703.1 extracellular solute-binding protein [Dehalococcoidia bacterium]
MKWWLFTMGMLVGLAVLSACAAGEKATPAPTTLGAEGKAAWEQEWDRVLAAAKQEGKVALLGPAGDDIRRALTEPFEKKYGIAVEFQGGAGPEFGPKIRSEREAGQYLWDVYIHGTSTQLYALKPLGALDPIEPALILPEVKDPQQWRGGKLWFVDADRTTLMPILYSVYALMVNPNLVKPEEFRSWKDLLDPKWKGRLLLHDPRVAGPSQALFAFFHQHKELGPDFIRALARQEPALARDLRQELDWLGAGRFPILIGGSKVVAVGMVKQGAPIGIVAPQQMKEGGFLASGANTLSRFSRPAHPNAAKIYVNWFLSREGQIVYSRAAGSPSLRVDVPSDHAEPWELPQEGYWLIDTEEGRALEARVIPFLRELFGD